MLKIQNGVCSKVLIIEYLRSHELKDGIQKKYVPCYLHTYIVLMYFNVGTYSKRRNK